MVALGVPPDASLMLTVMAQQMRLISGLVVAVWLLRTSRAMYLKLPPGEQIRRHRRAGGWCN